MTKVVHLYASQRVSRKAKDGKDAVNINLSPSELVYNADKDGNISSTQFNNNSSTVSATRGGKAVSCSTSIVSKDNCEANIISSNVIKITKITTESVGTGKYVPSSAGGVKLKVTVDGTDYYSYLPFRVNINTFVKTVLETDESFQRKYTEISNKYNAVSSELNKKADLKTVESTIEQTAKNIKLEVVSKTSGRRNMLVNSAFRNQDSVFIHPLARIEKNTGVDGINCIHSSDKYSGTGDGNYIGAFWDSTLKNGVVTNIPIVKGKKYVISCWIKSDNKALPFVIECFFMKSINQQSRADANGAISVAFKVHEKNKWEKISCVLNTNNADATEYLAVNFWSNNKNVPKPIGATEYPTCHAYICKPMMEEGDTYGGWTLSEDDYEYVGGNILDNTRSLEKSGNLEKEESEIINEGYEYAYAVAHSNNTTSTQIEMLQWNVAGRINDGQDYMFSFLAKGTGMVSTYLRKDETPRFFVESSNNKHNAVSSDGRIDFELTKEWKRYWVHYHLNTSSGHPLPEKLLIRCYGGNEVYICQPKLEDGARPTSYTERKTDLVDKDSLKKAGIEITTDKVKLYGEKVQVLTRIDGTHENQEAAMFQGGKLNANLIDADKIEVKHLWAKSEDGTNKVGYFGNYEIEACKVNNANAPLFVGADTAAKSPFYVTNNGHMVSTSAMLGCFSLDKMSLRYISGYDDEEPGFALYNNYMLFREYSRTFNQDTHTWKSERKRMVWLGEYETLYQVPALLSNLLIDDSFSVNGDTLKSGIRISVTGCDDSQQYDNPTYNLSNAVYGNFAIYAEHGMYGGLRPMTRKINRSMELTDMDCFVIVTKAVTLTLPAKPQRGQYYKFLQVSDNFVIKSSLNNMLWYGVVKNSFTSGALNQTTELIYDGSNWNVNWFIGK